MQELVDVLQRFEFGYPFVMAWVWVAGAVFFWWIEERRGAPHDRPPVLARPPKVAIIVPCHNEAAHIAETIDALTRIRYPDYEIVAVDDGSTDDTGRVLDALAPAEPRLRVVHHAKNQGKANALRTAVGVTDAPFVICVDGDALLDEHAVTWMVAALERSPRNGAVTGNPRIRSRSTTLGQLQVGEFSSLIGLIKRSQMVLGYLFTVSGVVCGFRRAALIDVGLWRTDALTEDVDVSWRLQLAGWRVRFEPRALCWILTPETLRGLWRQRLRWATGGVQVFVRCLPLLWRRGTTGMWFVAAEYVTSMLWAVGAFLLAALWILNSLPGMDLPVSVRGLLPGLWGIALGAMFMLQVAIGMVMDRRYDPGIEKYLPAVISYPLVYWTLAVLASVAALPWAVLHAHRGDAVWVSPDRGLRADS